MSATPMRNGLVLTGGGARAAYQVGVLRAISKITNFKRNPFQIVTGFSAGAINGTWLASRNENFDAVTLSMWNAWSGMTMNQVFKTNTGSLFHIALRWIKDRFMGGMQHNSINHLLDTSPLADFLKHHIDFEELRRNLSGDEIYGLSMIAANYQTGKSTAFFSGNQNIKSWKGLNRISVRTDFKAEHIMASAAIPIFFPPIQVDGAFYGDGMIRLGSPLSPAIHMGADRMMIIGIRGPTAEQISPPPVVPSISLGEIAGTILNGLFFDSLVSDLDRMEKINRTVSYMSPEELKADPDGLRSIPLLSLHPSTEVSLAGACELKKLPITMRYLLRGLGVTETKGQDLLSYLSFEPKYLTSLLELGYADTLARKDEILAFFEGQGHESNP
jgi:NTE family protein